MRHLRRLLRRWGNLTHGRACRTAGRICDRGYGAVAVAGARACACAGCRVPGGPARVRRRQLPRRWNARRPADCEVSCTHETLQCVVARYVALAMRSAAVDVYAKVVSRHRSAHTLRAVPPRAVTYPRRRADRTVRRRCRAPRRSVAKARAVASIGSTPIRTAHAGSKRARGARWAGTKWPGRRPAPAAPAATAGSTRVRSTAVPARSNAGSAPCRAHAACARSPAPGSRPAVPASPGAPFRGSAGARW